MAPVYFFTGENAFALRQEKVRWTGEFAAKHGAENLLQVDGNAISLRNILDEVSVGAFIAEKRLVVVRGLPRWTKEEMRLFLDAVHPSSVVLFCDPAPDKRLGGYKELAAAATVKDFPALRGAQLRDWVLSYARQQGGVLEPSAATLLLEIVGEEQDMLAQEIAKLALLGRPATLADVRMLAVPSGGQEVWQLTTLIAKADLPGALAYVQLLLRSGEDAFSLWNILLWLLRCLGAVSLCAAEGERNPAKIASIAGVPFPTARMLLPLAQDIPPRALRPLIAWAVRADRDLKTGGYRATSEAPQELLSLVDDLIVRCCRLADRHPRSV